MLSLKRKLANAYYKTIRAVNADRYFFVRIADKPDAVLIISGLTPWGRAAALVAIKALIYSDHPMASISEVDEPTYKNLIGDGAMITTVGVGFILVNLERTVD